MRIKVGFVLFVLFVLGAYLDTPLVSLMGLIGILVLGGLFNLKRNSRSIPAEQPLDKIPTMRRK